MDVKIPNNLQRAMAAEAEAARNARAQVIGAEGEWKASTALREASEVVSSNPAALQVLYSQARGKVAKVFCFKGRRNQSQCLTAGCDIQYLIFITVINIFQLRYLQTLVNISAENPSTIIYPVPVDVA